MSRLLSTVTALVVVALGALVFYLGQEKSFAETPKAQTPTPPYPYAVETFTLPASTSGVTLSGTLTAPKGEGRYPAAILLSVAGPNDRDQSFAGHKGFHVLADYLTRRGTAVARFDDRGVGASTGDYFDANWEDLAKDAQRVAEYLAADPRIDPAKIGYIGMSQGGAVGAMAARATEGAFVVLLSAPGLPGEEALKLQLEKTLDVSGVTGARAEKYRALFADFIEIAKSDPADPETFTRMKAFLGGPGRALIPPYQFMPKDADGIARILLGPWYQSNVHFDPDAAYGDMVAPVLAIGGEKDFVAPPDEHLSSIEGILGKTPTTDVTIRRIANLNHSLQEAETGLPTEYAKLENSFSPIALEIIGDWINERFGTGNGAVQEH